MANYPQFREDDLINQNILNEFYRTLDTLACGDQIQDEYLKKIGLFPDIREIAHEYLDAQDVIAQRSDTRAYLGMEFIDKSSILANLLIDFVNEYSGARGERWEKIRVVARELINMRK